MACDLRFVSAGRLPPGGVGDLRTADLVVEAFSRATAVYDRQMKGDTYAALGVREVWLVDFSRHEIEQCVLDQGTWRVAIVATVAGTVRASVLPGCTLTLRELFKDLPRE